MLQFLSEENNFQHNELGSLVSSKSYQWQFLFIYFCLFAFGITECIDLNISKYNQSIAVLSFVVILINPPIIFPSISNGSLFTLAPESFW